MPWTSEPWPEVLDVLSRGAPRRVEVMMPGEDYNRARACVNALAGRDPEKLAELEATIDELLTHESWSQAGQSFAECWDDLRNALAAFRQQKGNGA